MKPPLRTHNRVVNLDLAGTGAGVDRLALTHCIACGSQWLTQPQLLIIIRANPKAL